jgi:hypothetical protein
MTLLKLFQVMVGLIMAYLLLSLITSAIQEILASIFKVRGRNLMAGLRTLLTDSSPQGSRINLFAAIFPRRNTLRGSDLFQQVSGHPLVSNLSPSRLASYVPASNFTLALIDVLRSGAPQSLPLFAQIEHGVTDLTKGPAQECINTFLADAGGDIERFKQHLKAWYDDAMDRTSGIYRRFALYFAVIFGLVLAISFNVDTIYIVSTLWQNPSTAASVMKAAQSVQSEVAAGAANQTSLQNAIGQLLSSPLPIGWTSSGNGGDVNGNSADRPVSDDQEFWLVRFIGWLITGVAVSVGAPFWFDALGTFLNIRGAGPVPVRANVQENRT